MEQLLATSNYFICASSVLSAFLSKLFTAMLRHGYVPKSLRDCILQPIPKPGKDSSVSDNYRSIALAPTLSKVFEWCILIQFHTAFVTSGLQFGFKRGVAINGSLHWINQECNCQILSQWYASVWLFSRCK